MNDVKFNHLGFSDNELYKDLLKCIIIAIGSFIIINRSFLVFHTLAESVSVIIAFLMLSISFSTYSTNTNKGIIYLGIAYGFVGIFDLIHIFTYNGMGTFADNTGNIPAQMWIVARYIESISYLISFVLEKKKVSVNIRRVFFIYLPISLFFLVSILYLKIFPDCFISGNEITLFKMISEYIIVGIYITGIIYYIRSNKDNIEKTQLLIILSLTTGAVSEVFFSLYEQTQILHSYGLTFKLISYYFIYMAFIKTSLQEPYVALQGLNQTLMNKNSRLEKLIHELETESRYRKNIERENLKKRQILNGVLESTIDGILVLDNDHNLIHVNSRFLKMMNISRQVVFSEDIEQLMDHIRNNSIDPEDFDIYCKESLQAKGPYTYYLRHKNNKVFEVTALPYIDSGQKSGIVINFRDITDREMVEELKRNIEIRKKLLRKAKEIDEIKTNFFTNISHEIRTPLNIILGVIQLLDYSEANISDGSYQISEESVRALRKNSYRLIKLADNMMDITSIDSGYMHLNLLNHNIISIVRETTYSVADYVKGSDISINFKTDMDERIMACDAQKIERVLLNLLSNAVKFTECRGSILVSLENKKESIVIRVKDDGIGIPRQMIDKIFDRLKQVDSSLRRMNEGTGIGLTIVKSIVEMHGGSISVKSKVDEGSEFIIELPVQIVKEEKVHADTYMGIDRVSIEFSDIYGID